MRCCGVKHINLLPGLRRAWYKGRGMAKRKAAAVEPGQNATLQDTSLRMVQALYRDAQHYAIDCKRSVSSLINEILRDHLRARNALSEQARKDTDEYLKKRRA